MLSLGIDPGTHRIGWALVEGKGSKQRTVSHGCLNFKSGTEKTIYLPEIYQTFADILQVHRPEIIGLETLLFQKNVKTAITVAEARGVIALVAAQAAVPVIELAPNVVKAAIAGHGGADKSEVNRMVGLLLGIKTSDLLDDEVDAIAIAMTTLITYRLP